MALAKVNRLRHWRDFQVAYQQGRRYSGELFTLFRLKQFFPKHKTLEPIAQIQFLPTKLGVSISLKVSKKAVIRNRLKRQILAGFQTLLPDVVPGWRLVVVVKPQAVGCNYGDFLRELKQLLIQAEVFNGH